MNTHTDPAVDSRACPACKSQLGEPCNTVVDGAQTHWTHDARFYAVLAARISSDDQEVGR